MKAVKKTTENGIGKGTPGPGRPPGCPNKTTAALKEAILEAGRLAGEDAHPNTEDGLVAYLRSLAKGQPVAFAGLLGKVLPMTVAGDGTTKGTLVVTWSDEPK